MHLISNDIVQLPGEIKQDILETPRLLLKEITPEIYSWLFTSRSDAAIMAYLGLTPEGLAVERNKFQKGMTTFRTSYKNFLLINKESLLPIGRCGYHNWYAQHRRAEIGYLMDNDDVMGKGFMKEALRSIVRYGFEAMGLNRIEALISPRNTPSVRLVAGLGFTCEGVLREHYCKADIAEDSACYSLLKREYEANKAMFI
jgi:ribosomal-protein-alanine N-acetyltransferase